MPPMQRPLDLLSTTEAAGAIGVERSTLSRWVDQGRMSFAHRLPGPNGAMLFDRPEVERVAAIYRKGKGSAPERVATLTETAS